MDMKKMSYLLLCLSLLCVTIFVFYRSVHLAAPSKADYDHSILVLDWPNGYCSNRSCLYCPLPQKFGIHGLWPMTKDGKDIKNCDPSANITSIFDNDPQLQVRLLNDWPSLSAKSQDIAAQRGFWNHEWTKHGSCQTVMTPEQYFDKGLELNGRVDLLNALAAKQMIPGGSYTRARYTEAIQAKIGKLIVYFRCARKNSVQLLQEVVVCVDKSAHNFIGCDKEQRRDNCKTNAITLANRDVLLQEAAAAHYKDMEL